MCYYTKQFKIGFVLLRSYFRFNLGKHQHFDYVWVEFKL